MKWKSKVKVISPVILVTAVMVLAFSILSAQAGSVVAWSAQSGPAKAYTVLFDGEIFNNRWWVESSHCPADAGPDNYNNPWQYQRKATADELENIDNPTTCDAGSTNPGDDQTGTGGGGRYL